MTKQDVQEKLKTDNRWLYRGLLAIWKLQTREEKLVKTTINSNKIGFNIPDAGRLSKYAYRVKNFGCLDDYALLVCRKKMMKYAGQLARLANGEIKNA